MRAAVLCEEGHFAEAAELLRPFAERERSDLDSWLLLARAELAAGLHERALQAAEHCAALVPSLALPQVIASVAAFRLGRNAEAVERARRAVAVEPEDAGALVWLARILVVERHFDEARAVAARAVELAPEETRTHMTAGTIAATAGERDAARAFFRAVLALDPADGAAQHELARLRLRRRLNDPAVLAEAAAGFARAAGSPRAVQRSSSSVEGVLRVFLSKTAYLLFVDAYLVARIASTSTDATARLLPVVLLGVPAYYAARFLRRLTPAPRRRLLWMLIGERAISAAATLEIIAIVGILGGALGGAPLRSVLAAVAAAAALAARLTLYLARDRSRRAAAGQPSSEHAVRASLIWTIAAIVALLGAALIVAAALHDRPGAAIGALLCAAAAIALSRIALRRRLPR